MKAPSSTTTVQFILRDFCPHGRSSQDKNDSYKVTMETIVTDCVEDPVRWTYDKPVDCVGLSLPAEVEILDINVFTSCIAIYIL